MRADIHQPTPDFNDPEWQALNVTAVPPRPAAGGLPYPLGRHCCGALNPSVCHQRGLCWMEGVHPDSPGYTPAALDATAGDGLREAIARWFADTAAKPHGMPPYSDLSWAHVRHIWLMEADELLALPALRDVLAAAARDAERVARVRAELDDLAESKDPADRMIVGLLRRALDPS